MLMIRLSRIGKTKKPFYRLIISEKARDTYGRALEILGTYDPFTKELKVEKERIEHWLSVGAQMSATVNNLLVGGKIIKGEKIRAFNPPKPVAKETKTEEKKEKEKKEEESNAPVTVEDAPIENKDTESVIEEVKTEEIKTEKNK
ncbi:MAG: 30S ribosomal protein S16 [bacterium]